MDEHGPTRLDLGAAFDERLDGAGLQQCGGGRLLVDRGRKLEQRCGGNEPRRCIGVTLRSEGRDAVAGLEAMDIRTDRDHLARRLDTETAGKVDRIGAVAVIGVDIVEPNGGLANEHLARPRIAERDLAPVDDLWSALAFDEGFDRLHAAVSCCSAHLVGLWTGRKGKSFFSIAIARSRRQRSNPELRKAALDCFAMLAMTRF